MLPAGGLLTGGDIEHGRGPLQTDPVGLRAAGRKVHAPEKTFAVPDHNVPTTPDRLQIIKDPEGKDVYVRNAWHDSDKKVPSLIHSLLTTEYVPS